MMQGYSKYSKESYIIHSINFSNELFFFFLLIYKKTICNYVLVIYVFLIFVKKKCAYQVFTCLLFSIFCSLDDVQFVSYILLAKVLFF